MLKDLFVDTLQEMLEKWKTIIGYSKHDYKNKTTSNSRNGRSKKTVISQYGEADLQIPRDREGEFEPQIVKKDQTQVTGIEDQVISMYAKGMTTRDIQYHLNQLYGIE